MDKPKNHNIWKFTFYFCNFLTFFTLHLFSIIFYDVGMVEFAITEQSLAITLVIMCRLLIMRYFRTEIQEMYKIAHTKFWNSNIFGPRYEKEYTYTSKLILMIAELNAIFGMCVIIIKAVVPIFLNYKKRELAFKFWLPVVDQKSSPVFEILTLFQFIVCGCFMFAAITSFDFTFAGICILVLNQLKMLQHALKSIGYDRRVAKQISPDICEDRDLLRVCIKHHILLIRTVQFVNETFNIAMLFQALGSFNCLFCAGYMLVTQHLEFMQMLDFSSYVVTLIVELFTLTYVTHEVYAESLLVADAAYESGWYFSESNELRRDIRLLIQLAQVKRPFSAAGLFVFDLTGFVSVLHSAFSAITLLQSMAPAEEH